MRLEDVVDMAIQVFQEEKHHIPVLIVEGKDGVAVIGLYLPEDKQAKLAMMRFAGEKTAFLEPQTIYFIFEGWYCYLNSFEELDKLASEVKGKREALVVCRSTKQRDVEVVVLPFVRSEGEVQIVWDDVAHLDGDISNSALIQSYWAGVDTIS